MSKKRMAKIYSDARQRMLTKFIKVFHAFPYKYARIHKETQSRESAGEKGREKERKGEKGREKKKRKA